MNPYETLGVSANASAAEVNSAHRRMRGKAHPDRNGGDNSKMSAINEARDILLNPERKARFDQIGSTGKGPATTEEMAIITLGNIFLAAVDGADEYTSVPEIFSGVAATIAKGYLAAKEAKRALPSRLTRARKCLKAVKCDPLLQKAFESRIAHLERQGNEINQQIQMGNLMLKLMNSIKFKTYAEMHQ